jgi:hypothetical protein
MLQPTKNRPFSVLIQARFSLGFDALEKVFRFFTLILGSSRQVSADFSQ